MAFTQQISSIHWIVHMESPSKSEIKVEVHMSREAAQRLTHPPESGVHTLNFDGFNNLGAAVLERLV